MPSNMVLPVYSGDKNKEGGFRKVVANRLLHLRLCFSRYQLPIVIMLAVVVLFVVLFAPRLPTAPSDIGTQVRPDLKVGIGQKDAGDQPVVNPEPVLKNDGAGTGAGIELPSAQQQEKQRQDELHKVELAEQKAAEERAAAERAAAEAQHQGDENSERTDKKEPDIVANKPSVEELPEAREQRTAGVLTPPKQRDTDVWSVPAEHVEEDPTAREHQVAVREAFLHAWRSYEKFAWGFDELRPQSKQGMNWLSSGLGATIVDSLSTMHAMGLEAEFKKARDWVKDQLPSHIENAGSLSFFECTIRILGGLVSAHDLTNDPVFLEQAKNVADRLMRAFNSPTGLPRATVNFKDGSASSHGWTRGNSILAEVGTIQMEFCTLSKKLNDPKYCDTVMKVMKVLQASQKPKHGLYPYYINPETGAFNGQQVSLGALGDSFYEYLLKLWLLSGKRLNDLKKMYKEQGELIVDTLVRHNNKWTYIAEINGNGALDPKMDHLACFVSGMFGMGAVSNVLGSAASSEKHMEAAKGIGEVCYRMYSEFPFGLSPESVRFTDDGMNAAGTYYIMRPEAVEALFYMWRLTKDPKWREYGWKIFQAINKHCKADAGYTGIRDATARSGNAIQDDQQQSFFLAETLKYLYLLFSPDSLLPLDEWVFNTEAHPLRVWKNEESIAHLFTVFGDPIAVPDSDQKPVPPPAV